MKHDTRDLERRLDLMVITKAATVMAALAARLDDRGGQEAKAIADHLSDMHRRLYLEWARAEAAAMPRTLPDWIEPANPVTGYYGIKAAGGGATLRLNKAEMARIAEAYEIIKRVP